MADEQDIQIAVLGTQMEGLREQQKAHADTNDKKFDRVFEYLKPISEFVSQNRETSAQVKTLWDFHQQNKGFLSATRLITGAMGGLMVFLADFVFRK